MSKILIFRFEAADGPGFFGSFLDKHEIEYQVLKIDQNDATPTSIDGASALVFMGGAMSANDALGWIPPVLDLIRRGHEADIPMLGHCLGGQLISKALGGSVTKNPVEEIGWLSVRNLDNPDKPRWCAGLPSTLHVFQWHNETFSIPPNAVRLFSSDACPNQGFQIGKTLGLQFHLEILPEMVLDWATRFIDDNHVPGATVQSRQAMLDKLAQKAEQSMQAADLIYGHWCGQLK